MIGDFNQRERVAPAELATPRFASNLSLPSNKLPAVDENLFTTLRLTL
jgi:hypothetical protein